MQEFIKPNWKRSNLNISSTLAEFLGAPNSKPILPELKKELDKGYKNVVFICLDGFGIYPLERNLDPNDFLRTHVVETLTSTFPSTTTNATTALTCNKYPLEHGWLGWSLHFDEIGKNVDIYLRTDSQTREKISYEYPISDNSDCYFNNVNTDYEISSLLPCYVKTRGTENRIDINDESDLCKEIKNICMKPNKQFIYAYLPEPDATMHEYGVSSLESKLKIQSINECIEKMCEQLEDTLIIITADHGQVDITDYVEFYKDVEINSMLEYTPFLDARSPAFKVKKGMEKAFEEMFTQKYGEDFALFKSKDLIENGFFGYNGNYGHLLGDYIAVGTYTHKQFLYCEEMPKFRGHHTSLTEEMLVPLILLKGEK